MNRRKIVFFIDSLGGGGAERVVSVISNALVETKAYDITIIMLRKSSISYDIDRRIKLLYAEDLKVHNIYGKVVRLLFSCYKRVRQSLYKPIMVKLGIYDRRPNIDETSFYFYANYATAYREYIERKKPDTTIGFLVRSNICMLMATKRTKVKTIFCERNNPKREDLPRNIIKIRDRLCTHAKAAVFQTEDQRSYYGMIKCPTAVIPNPVKSGLPGRYTGVRRKEIVNFCRLSKQKNIKLLIDAFILLSREVPEYTLRIFGEGDERDSIKEYIEARGMQEKIFLEHFVTDIHERIIDAAMFVSTSDYEGISNSMIEAMAIGLPCVCTDCDGGGARSMIRDHENGLLVPKGDMNAICKAMKEIINNSNLAGNISENAYKIREELSIDKITQRWREVID